MIELAGDSQKKLFVGPRFRRIRQQLGLSQTQIAEGLGISPSYVNLIERNQRPVTAQILLRLAETYDLDLRDLATADEDRFFAELNEIFSDPLFRQIDLPKQELEEMRKSYDSAFNDRIADAMRSPWEQLHKMLTGMSEKLTEVTGDDGKKRYHDSLVTNPLELCGLLTKLNITNDPKLEEARRQLEITMLGANIEAIKEDAGVRSELKSKVDSILNKFNF